MKNVIILSAMPGSGKSTWARKFSAEHPNTHIISSDEIRKEFFGRIDCFDNEPLVWKTFLERLQSYSNSEEDVYVIADSTNLQNKYRKYYFDQTPGYDKHTLVLFDIPYEICLLQNQMRSREKVLPLDAMERLHKELETPSEEVLSLYDEVIHITDYAASLKQ